MKIAMLYASWEKFGEPWSTPQGVKRELISRGHEVRHYNLYHGDGYRDPKTNMIKYSNEGINRLMMEVRAYQFVPDVVFVMDYGPWDAYQLDKKFFPGTVIVKECGDEPQAHRQHSVAAPRVHVLLSPDWPCVERYRAAGHLAEFWTHHADHRLFYPRPDVQVQFDCVTTCGGGRQGGLTEEIKSALGDSFNNERYFYGEDHAKRLCMGNIVFQCSQFKEVTRRIFEGMACGKMVLTDRLPEHTRLHEMFKDGEDIVYYDSARDAIEKIRYFTNHPEEREEIARNGKHKLLSAHTVAHRVDEFEDAVEKARETLLV